MTINTVRTTSGASNSNLSSARKVKDDEFYTRLEDIERELTHYGHHFKDKTVFLNCDDPSWSNFWVYFELNFEHLRLKRLISTHYRADGTPSYAQEIAREADGSMGPTRTTVLMGSGDFRSEQCIELLEQSDIVVTNPPFSLFREYVAQLVNHDKKFIILGNMNAVTYKEIWPLIQDQKAWLGSTPSFMGFRVPDDHPPRPNRFWVDEDGTKWRSLGNACWFTNLEHARRYEDVVLFRSYAEDPSKYPKYANYDAIEVGKVADIPSDYEGEMGVPITFLGKHNPEQFEIVGYSRQICMPMRECVPGAEYKGSGNGAVYLRKEDGTYREMYDRIVIRRKK